ALPYPSVMTTENAILAASSADGESLLSGVAIEPEVLDLIAFLNKRGGEILLEGERTLRIQGKIGHHEIHHPIMPDRIEAASYGMAAIATGGDLWIEGANPTHLSAFLEPLQAVGGGVEIRQGGIRFFHQRPLEGSLSLTTGVHPGFLTDWQQPFAVFLTQVQGLSSLHETVYENRMGYVEEMQKRGANMTLSTECGESPCRFHDQHHLHHLTIEGSTPLHGGDVTIPDLRAGFAYLLAALISPEESRIGGLQHVDRGYSHLTSKLRSLGVDVERILPS
ncbi:MAG: UDP-N-acetylglucosamine 1-carboxyvinyltransferase, partial [Chlamydiota bacterium]|nr:UDP-N-acetylglucosamine 1-carboxyvinyltransferase [Chlamydiota bacterium]